LSLSAKTDHDARIIVSVNGHLVQERWLEKSPRQEIFPVHRRDVGSPTAVETATAAARQAAIRPPGQAGGASRCPFQAVHPGGRRLVHGIGKVIWIRVS
jgi:hypothetical protein